jgi:hypothetical protein
MSRELLPDSRARVASGAVRGRGPDGVERVWVPAYCANCGVQHGHVTETALAIFVLCTRCDEQHGVPAGCLRAPVEVFAEQIAEETAKMSPLELAVALDAPNSSLSKLRNDFRRLVRG